MTEMRAATLPGPGRLEDITVTSLPVPEPGPGQLLLETHCCGLNPVDWKLARFAPPQWGYPHAVGIDVVGTVVAAGPQVSRSLLGTRVNAMVDLRGQGTAAQYVLAEVSAVAAVAEAVSDEAAATMPCPGITAHQLVFRSAVMAADRVLVWGADGAVGTFATQLAARTGADVTAVSADPDRMRRFGAARSATRGEIDVLVGSLPTFSVVLDCVGVERTAASMAWLGFGGRYASVSQANPQVPAFTTALSVIEIAIGAAYSAGEAKDVAALGTALQWLNRQRLETPEHAVVDLAGAGAALEGMRTHGGKAVVRIGDGGHVSL